MVYTLHRASRSITDEQDQRIASDEWGKYRVIVEGDRVYDAELWCFPELAGEGLPLSQVTFDA